MNFSVVIPTFNSQSLSLAIDSCLNQSSPPYEIIVVDDASIEYPAELLRPRYLNEVESGRLKFITLRQNAGPSAARNVGWDAATGDYVAFLDADDAWHPFKLANVKTWLSSNPDIDWIAHRYSLNSDTADVSSQPPRRLSLRRMMISNVAQTSCVVLRRSIPIQFNEKMRYCEDYDLWLRIISSGYHCCYSHAELGILGRPQLSAGGLSGNLWAMRRGEMLSYLHLSQIHRGFVPVLPLFFAYSLVKHVRRIVTAPTLFG